MKFEFLLMLFFLIGCQTNKKEDETQKLLNEADKFIDSVNIAKKADSMTKQIIRSALFDTIGISTAPIKVLSAKVIKEDYSRDVRLVWKNISSKKISAVKFKWYGVDAFNNPADMGQAYEGIGGGFTDDPIAAGQIDNGSWSTTSGNVKRIICAWPYEVAFSDGTFWKQNK
jgi:hypothetical protein